MIVLTGDKPKNRRLKDRAVPHIFNWSKSSTVASCNRSKSKKKRNYREERRLLEEAEAVMEVTVGNIEEITT